MSQIRLEKILSMAGIASRRAAETLISQGRVSVNGRTVTELGSKADPAADDIRVDGRRVKSAEPLRYLLLHKRRDTSNAIGSLAAPHRNDLLRGVQSTSTWWAAWIMSRRGYCSHEQRGSAAGLTHPRHGLEREYEAWVLGAPDEHDRERLRRGVLIDERRTIPATVELVHQGRGKRAGQTLLSITIREGRNRQVRRMCEAIGQPVESLTRVRIGPIRTPSCRRAASGISRRRKCGA